MPINKALPWIGLFVGSFAAFAWLRLYEESRQPQRPAVVRPESVQLARVDPAPVSTAGDSGIARDSHASHYDEDAQSEAATLTELAADEDASTREEARALMEAIAADPDGDAATPIGQ